MLLTFVAAFLSLVITTFSSHAVPAMPGSCDDCGGDTCPSEAAENPVTLEVLEQNRILRVKKEAEEKKNNTNTINGMRVNGAAGLNGAAATKGLETSGVDSEEGNEFVTDTDYYIPLICIVVGFEGTTEDAPEGMPYVDSFDWAESIFRSKTSLTQYYRDMSYGTFTFNPAQETSAYGVAGNTNTEDRENDGIIHVVTEYPHKFWSGANLDYTTFYPVMYDALMQSGEYVDYTQYDLNEDGKLGNDELAICFIIAGYDAANAGGYFPNGVDNYFWAHAWSIDEIKKYRVKDLEYPTPDGIRINDYVAIPELQNSDTEELKMGNLSTLFHELGHYLGLPDLYDTNGDDWDEWYGYRVEYMSLMDSGCWGITADGSNTTYSLDVWSKVYLGWITPYEVDRNIGLTLMAEDGTYSQENKDDLVIRIPTGRDQEYYLVENHHFTGWDKDMAYGIAKKIPLHAYEVNSGVVIWHIDEQIVKSNMKMNLVNDAVHRPGVMPLYPEENYDGSYSLISDWDGSVILNPFFSVEYDDEEEGDEESGGSGPKSLKVRLPGYGEGEDKDYRDGREYTCVELTIMPQAENGVELDVKLDVHTPGTPVEENLVEPKGGVSGGYDEVTYCSYCGEKISSRHVILPPTGWQKVDGSWYFYDEDGFPVKNTWLRNGGRWYRFSSDGKMITGWASVGGKWYYLNPGSGEMKTGWVKTGGKWYYLTPGSGEMKTGWLSYGGNWYFLNPGTGAMQTGWKKIQGKDYYFTSEGVMACDEWIQGYYLDQNGVWDGKAKVAWHKDSRGWWYGTGSRYLSDGTFRIDGKTYTFDKDGYMTE